MKSIVVALLFFAFSVGAVGVARGDAAHPSDAARRKALPYLERGRAAYEAEHYDDASLILRAGMAIARLPEFLYALGQTERKRGDCQAAMRYYREFIESGATPEQMAAAQYQVERCQQELKPAEPIVSAPTPVEPTPSSPGRTRKIVGFGAAGAGVALVIAGIAFGVAAGSVNDQLNHPAPNSYFDPSLEDQRSLYQGLTIAFITVGVAALVVGTTVALVKRDRPRTLAWRGLVF